MIALLAELRRRNVFRVAAAYLVVGWLLMQIGASLETGLGLPVWTDTLIIVLLGLGLPVALLFAWAFEMTPEGVKLTINVPEDESIAPEAARKFDIVILVALVAVIGMIGWQKMAPGAGRADAGGSESIAAGPSLASIAVLPFADLSPNGDQAHFSDGIAEEILNVLVRLDGLQVTSRTSAFAYKGVDLRIPEIAADLGVRHVLEGSVRTSGNSIRVTAQLIDAEADEHLWSQTYDRTLTPENLFAIQDDISAMIVQAIREQVGVEIGAIPAVSAPTDDVDAYEHYLRARHLYQGRVALDEADRLLATATELDPGFADAWALRAAIYQIAGDYGFRLADGQASVRSIGREYAARAMSLVPDHPLALATIGLSYDLEMREGNGSQPLADILAIYDRVIVNVPDATDVRNWRGLLLYRAGFLEAALDDFSRCAALDPMYAPCRHNVATALVSLGRNDDAWTEIRRTLDDGAGRGDVSRLLVFASLGERDAFLLTGIGLDQLFGWRDFNGLYDALVGPDGENRAIIARYDAFLRANNRRQTVDAALLIGMGDYSINPKLNISWLPLFAEYRRSPEFHSRVRNERIHEYWREHGFPPQCRPLGADDFECD